MYVMNKKWDSITNIAQCTSVYVSPEHEIKAVPTGGGNVYRLGQYETAEIARAVLNDLYMHIPTGCICDFEVRLPQTKAPRNRREEQLRMAQNEGAEIAWLVMAATTHLTFGFGKERLARLKQETLDNYRQYIGWVEQDGEAYAMELLRRCSEQALQEELKINDMRESKDHILPGGSAEAQRADMLRAMEAVSAKMAAERGITRQPLAVLSQNEISRRMKAI